MRSLIAISALFLVACAPLKPTVEPTIVVKKEYIVRIPPAETMQLPEAPKPPKPNASGVILQSAAAAYIVEMELYSTLLKNKLVEIAKFLQDEKAKLEPSK